MSKQTDKLMTSAEAAEYLSVERQTLAVWRCTKRYPDLDQRKLARLLKSKPKAEAIFKGSWNGDYASQSEADQALANFARRAKWSPQQTCDLLVVVRANAGEEPKHVVYYSLTIGKAKARKSAPPAPSSTPGTPGVSGIRLEPSEDSDSDDWGKLVLVDDPGDLPSFPVNCVPKSIGNWAQAIAENSQTPIDLPAMLSLSTLAVATAKKAVIQPYRGNPDYTEPANGFYCVPLASANRKTFAVEQARKPFEAFLGLKQANSDGSLHDSLGIGGCAGWPDPPLGFPQTILYIDVHSKSSLLPGQRLSSIPIRHRRTRKVSSFS